MATTKLDLYNKALRMLGERKLASLSEERKPRRLLDDVWDQGGIEYCLEQAQWHFAMRTIQIDYDPSIEPGFGYRRAFVKPSDWVRTSALTTDEYFNNPLTAYSDEAGYWYSDHDLLYVKYVSNDASYGNDLNSWPTTFEDYVAAYFASEISLGVNSDENKYLALLKILDRKKLDAKSKDAQAESTKFPAPGSWSGSRTGTRSGRERGNRNSLLG
jgi:hypothetical protein